MTDWKEYKIADACELIIDCVNRTAPVVDYITPYKMVRTTNVKNGKINLEDVRYVTEEIYERWVRRGKPEKNDIVLTREAPVGEVGIVNTEDNIFLGQRMMMYRAKKGFTDARFLYYSFLAPFMQEQILSFGMGSVVEHIRVPDTKEFIVKLPPLSEQQAIAEVLSSLDDKIDLLHRQNRTLEALAETLFRQWFVEEAEESWDKKRLGDFIEIKHGYAFKGASIVAVETDKILVTPGNFKIGGGFNSHKFKYFNSEDFPVSYVLDEGDFVVTMTDLSQDNDTLGYPAFIPEIKGKRLLHNQRVGKVLFRENHSDKRFFLYHLMKGAEYRHYVLGSSSGMAVTHTSPNSIYGFDFNVPPDSLITRFEGQARMFYERERTNQQQIQTLTTLRDTLLPKLMSGEVRVKLDEVETAIAGQ